MDIWTRGKTRRWTKRQTRKGTRRLDKRLWHLVQMQSTRTCCTIITRVLARVLAQEMGSKSSIQVPGLENAPDAILDLDGQQHQKIGRFVKLHPLHQPGMLDDRWKLLAIGKTAECDLKSEAWAAIPLRCIPCNSSRWSE